MGLVRPAAEPEAPVRARSPRWRFVIETVVPRTVKELLACFCATGAFLCKKVRFCAKSVTSVQPVGMCNAQHLPRNGPKATRSRRAAACLH